MTSRDFAFWLQGFLEVAEPKDGLTPRQVELIAKHLSLVFIHEIDPSMPSKKLDEVHASPVPVPAPPQVNLPFVQGPTVQPGAFIGGPLMRC